MRVAVIPARGGSKRIPRKNVRVFAGRPIIEWSIEAALACPAIDRVIVSTDDEEIAAVAREAGAETPFMREAALADDHATTLAVLQDALARLEAEGVVDALCCLYATAPFVRSADLADAHRAFLSSGADYLFSATDYPFPIQRAFTLREGRVALVQPEHVTTRSQDLEPAYHDAGQFYWCRPSALREGRPILGGGSAIHPMPRERVEDIDTPQDWTRAEAMFALLRDHGEVA